MSVFGALHQENSRGRGIESSQLSKLESARKKAERLAQNDMVRHVGNQALKNFEKKSPQSTELLTYLLRGTANLSAAGFEAIPIVSEVSKGASVIGRILGMDLTPDVTKSVTKFFRGNQTAAKVVLTGLDTLSGIFPGAGSIDNLVQAAVDYWSAGKLAWDLIKDMGQSTKKSLAKRSLNTAKVQYASTLFAAA